MVLLMNKNNSLSDRATTTRQTSVGWMFQRLARTLDRQMTDRLAAFGLKIDHFVVLMTLSEREDVTQTELGDGISMPNYAITRALDHLEGEGLVERRPDATSRRSHRVFLTEAGTQLMPSLFATVKAVNETFLAPLPEAERADLTRILRALMAPDGQTKLPG